MNAEPTIPQILQRKDADRLRRYGENLAFYRGEQWPRPRRGRDRRLVFNYAKTLVE